MKKYPLVFVDDSGDPGMKTNSSDFLVMAAIIFNDQKEAEKTARKINEIKRQWGWSLSRELKFRKTRKDLIKEMLHSVKEYKFDVKAVYVNKSHFKVEMPNFRTSKLYNWSLSELLKISSPTGASVHIDGRANKKQTTQTRTYLRKELKKVEIVVNKIYFDDSARTELIQLADLIAGSAGRSLDRSKSDCMEYLKIIQKHVIRVSELPLNTTVGTEK